MRALLLVMCFLMLDLSDARSSDESSIESYLDFMLGYSVKSDEDYNQLPDLIADIESLIQDDENNPYLWYLKGRSSIAALSLYGSDSEKYKKYRKLIFSEYSKTLSLNQVKKTLTAGQLYKLYTKAFYESIAEEGAKQYLDLKSNQGRLDRKEHLRVLRETIIPLLIKQNKFDEAYQEMLYIDKYFPSNAEGSTGNNAWRMYFEHEIEKQKGEQKEVITLEAKLKRTVEGKKSISPKAIVEQHIDNSAQETQKVLHDGDGFGRFKFVSIIVVVVLFLLFGFIVVLKRK